LLVNKALTAENEEPPARLVDFFFIAVKGYKVAIFYLYYHKIRINIVIIIYIVRKNRLFL